MIGLPYLVQFGPCHYENHLGEDDPFEKWSKPNLESSSYCAIYTIQVRRLVP